MPRVDNPTFYVDECLDDDDFIDPIEDSGLLIVRHRKILKQGATDKEWIEEVSAKGYFAITHDCAIGYKPYQVELVLKNGLGLFIIQPRKISHEQKGILVAQNKRKLLSFISRNSRPYIAKITKSDGVVGYKPIDKDWGQRYPKK